ncbi:GtrA family protein [Alkalicoccus halolimnae]|uniref:GtrA family protein n=1 Tax=Alkalicoccus halolimnae TaxID=1667239 RepID=A0A5C7F1R9_9BACI|nr:GtrA family protein [Alkalicoccus halolimnae]TXF82298.1 GtrA family protein [Alkalicoccus halolimnae]
MGIIYRYRKGFSQLGLYSIVGVSCALLDIGVLNFLLYLFPTRSTFLLALFNTLAYTSAILNSYYWNSRFTFRVRKTRRQFAAFIGQALISLLIANGVFLLGIWIFPLLFPFSDWLNTNIAKGFSMFASSLASFFFIKFFVFTHKGGVLK